MLLPDAALTGVEINAKAVNELAKLQLVTVHHQSLLDYSSSSTHDLTLCKGVLIHIDPAQLSRAYETIHASSSRYICFAEYYNPTPTTVPYRGCNNALFKRDFAGDMLDKYPDLVLVDYGFVYHRDANFPQDDVTWFLMEKRSANADIESRSDRP